MMVHQLIAIIVNSMKGFYSKDHIAVAIKEGLKFCAPLLQENCRACKCKCCHSMIQFSMLLFRLLDCLIFFESLNVFCYTSTLDVTLSFGHCHFLTS